MILVTGATGFLGARVVAALRGRGLSVRATARRADALEAAFAADPQVELSLIHI